MNIIFSNPYISSSNCSIFFPLQGFFNLLVYFKPKILCYADKSKKKRNEGEGIDGNCFKFWKRSSQTKSGSKTTEEKFPIQVPTSGASTGMEDYASNESSKPNDLRVSNKSVSFAEINQDEENVLSTKEASKENVSNSVHLRNSSQTESLSLEGIHDEEDDDYMSFNDSNSNIQWRSEPNLRESTNDESQNETDSSTGLRRSIL